METKLYRNVNGEEGIFNQPFLVLHISSEESISDVEKFTGGKSVLTNKGYLLHVKNYAHKIEVGDYIVFITNNSPFTRVRITINKVRHSLPKDSYMICKPEEFAANFEEVNSE